MTIQSDSRACQMDSRILRGVAKNSQKRSRVKKRARSVRPWKETIHDETMMVEWGPLRSNIQEHWRRNLHHLGHCAHESGHRHRRGDHGQLGSQLPSRKHKLNRKTSSVPRTGQSEGPWSGTPRWERDQMPPRRLLGICRGNGGGWTPNDHVVRQRTLRCVLRTMNHICQTRQQDRNNRLVELPITHRTVVRADGRTRTRNLPHRPSGSRNRGPPNGERSARGTGENCTGRRGAWPREG